MGLLLIVFGGFIVLVGLYIQLVAPAQPTLGDGEKLVDLRHPSQCVAMAKLVVGIPLLAVAGHLFVFTRVPYVYPTVTLFVGLHAFRPG